jgi:hypothetical protein
MAASDALDNASDYGSDIDDVAAFEILSQAESQPLKNVVLEDLEEPCTKNESFEQRVNLRLSRLQQPLQRVQQTSSKIENIISQKQTREASVEVEYDESNRISFSRTFSTSESTR